MKKLLIVLGVLLALFAAAAIIVLDPVVGDEPALVPIMTRLGTLLKAV